MKEAIRLKVIAKAVDRYTPFTPVELVALKAAGIDTICAYIGRHTRGLQNGISPLQLKSYVAHGFKVIFNFEGASNHRSYFNTAEGERDGSDVVKEMAWLGVKPDPEIIIYNSVDYDAYLQADFAAVDAYESAYLAALKGEFSEGEYAGVMMLKHSDGTKHAPKGDWQSAGWSYGESLPNAKIRQVSINVWVAGCQVDRDDVYADPGWYPRPFVKPNPNKGGGNLTYTHTAVDVAGTDYDAIVVGDVTHVLWTACEALGSTVKNILHNGTLDINGKEVKCVVDGDNDYVPWAQMAHGVQAKKINGKWYFTVSAKPQPVQLPTVVNLWQWHGPIHNQVNQGACTGESAVGVREWYEVKRGWPTPFVEGAPEATYAWARIAEGDLNKDAGATLRDALLSLVSYGMAPKPDDPLDAQDLFVQPSAQAVADAAKFKIDTFHATSFGGPKCADDIATALAGGDPVVVSALFNTSFYAPISGVVDYTKGTPKPTEAHAFLILGYGDGSYFGVQEYVGTRLFACQQSWGTPYGIKLPGTDTDGFMLLTEDTVNQLIFNAYTLDVPTPKN